MSSLMEELKTAKTRLLLPKRLPRCADTRSGNCYPHQQEIVGHRDCLPSGGFAQAQRHCRVDCCRTVGDWRDKNTSVEASRQERDSRQAEVR
ncbi:hypothetical protein DPMN_031204 [Dreissena polymorpha]|uniref:Uncharacterized protein n=1 Tax=Dreissena polymorpha TaxID=45954 RepID=A0A9D4M252_DREPO|nr:hypothetical protein DPMN_031204 [Dreissena polymorpha]